MRPHPSSGFTLPEFAAAVAIIGIFAAIASTVGNGTVYAAGAAEARAALLDTYQSAIRHAATRGVHVVACPLSPAGGCLDGIDWTGGWVVFEDGDGDRDLGASERVVRTWPPLADRVRLRSTLGRKRLIFQPSGGNAGSNVTFTLCDGRGPARASRLVLSNTGKLRESAADAISASTCVDSAE